ncbi:MAG: hypothetical protein U0168_12275 [Nannocystaceae bacterium]
MFRRRALVVPLVAFCGFASACGGSDGSNDVGGGDGSGDSAYRLEYIADDTLLLDLEVRIDLEVVSGAMRPPALDGVRLGRAVAEVFGNGQENIHLDLSAGDDFESGVRFAVDLNYGRASDGERFDAGETVRMSCALLWFSLDGTDPYAGDECDVRRVDGGYTLTLVENPDAPAPVTGSVYFGPVPQVATPLNAHCADDRVCLSLDPRESDPLSGFCLPASNLRAEAAPCDAECTDRFELQAGDSSSCVCAAICGWTESEPGGGDPPTCDPSYGCIDV